MYGSYLALAQFLNKFLAVIAFVGSKGSSTPAWGLCHHCQGRLAFGAAGGSQPPLLPSTKRSQIQSQSVPISLPQFFRTPLEHFRHAGRHHHRFPHRFVVAPNFIATETNRGESALCATVGSLRFHGRALFAPHAPISSLLHNVGKHARLGGG